MISHGNVLANIEPIEREIQKYLRYERIFHPLRFLNLLPLSHVFGQMLGIFIPPLLAGTVVFIDSLKPSGLIDMIRHERISVFVAVPRFIESLQHEIQRQLERDGRLQQFDDRFRPRGEGTLSSALVAIPANPFASWLEVLGIHLRRSGPSRSKIEGFWNRLGYAVIQGYGMTETTSLISLNHPFHSAKGSIGKVFPGMEVRVDEQRRNPGARRERCKDLSPDDQSQPVAESDGWFRTGDIGETDENGRLYFKGRGKM